MKTILTTLMMTATLMACTSLPPDMNGDDGGDDGKADANGNKRVCYKQHRGTSADGDPVAFCDQAYNTRPLVRPTADSIVGTSARLTAGFVFYGGPAQDKAAFVTRDGTQYLLLDSAGNPQQGGDPYGFAGALLPGLRMPSNRNLFTLYALRGELRTVTLADHTTTQGIVVSSLVPAIVLTGDVVDGSFRHWEGEFAPSTGMFANAYDWTRAVRFRFDVETLVPPGLPFNGDGQLPVWGDRTETLPDSGFSSAGGTVANATSSVLAADGSCLRALHAGTFDPLAAVPDGKLALLRFPGMHAPGDQVLTIAPVSSTLPGDRPEGMHPIWVEHPAAFLMKDPPEQFAQVTFTPHGYPHNIAVRMRPVFGGGGACQ